MAVCAQTFAFYGCTNASGTTCTKSAQIQAFIPNATDPTNCAGSVLLSKTEYTDFLSNIANFGWDSAAFDVAIQGGFMFFAIGLGIGLLISVVRKFRV